MAVDPIRGAGDPPTRVAGAQTHALYEAHARMVYGLCRALLRDPDDADDATQATFISAYRSLLGGNDVREPAAWLATIARNECTARAQARMREPLPLLEADLRQAPGPEEELERRAVIEDLQQAIAGLPEKQREAVVLRDLYGLRYTEVGAALGMSVASVESLLFRARRSLRISLKPLAGGALTVPIAVREGIAQALPAFTAAGAAGGGAASGAAGLGLFAKLAGGPVAVKAAAGVAAAVAAGSIAVVGVERADRPSAGNDSGGGQAQPPGRGETREPGIAAGVASFAVMPTRSESPVSGGPDSGAGGHEQGSNEGGSEARGEGQSDDRRDDIGSSHGEHGGDGGGKGSAGSGATADGGTPEHSGHAERGDAAGAHGDHETAAGGEHDDVLREETSPSGTGSEDQEGSGSGHDDRPDDAGTAGGSGDREPESDEPADDADPEDEKPLPPA